MHSAPRVLLLAVEPGISLQVLFCLEAMGAEVHIMADGRARHLRWARGCTSLELLSAEQQVMPADLAAEIDRCAGARQVDVVIPSGILSTKQLVAARPHMKTPTVPLPSRSLFHLMDDKFALSEKLSDLGLAAPKTLFLGAPRQISVPLLEREIGYPVVVKPTDQGNSNGVVVCHDRSELIARVIDNPSYPYERLIAQEFIPGYDVDLSLLASDGKILAAGVQRRIGKTIHFVAMPEFIELGRQIIAMTGYSGPAHFDARLDARDGSIKIVECNPRFWASVTASLGCGVNFVAESIRATLEMPRDIEVTVRPGAYLPPTPMLANLLFTPWKQDIWTRANFRGLGQTLRNIAPYLSEEWIARSRQLTELRRTSGGHAFSPRLRFGKG